MSARAAVLTMGGAHHALGLAAATGPAEAPPLAFQPLRAIDDPAERAWAADWIGALFAQDNVPITPAIKDMIWSALTSLAAAPADERTLTGLALLLQSSALRLALAAYTLDGPYGGLLDAGQEELALADVQCFETEALMAHAGVIAPVLTYLFHRLETRFDGRPTGKIDDQHSTRLQ